MSRNITTDAFGNVLYPWSGYVLLKTTQGETRIGSSQYMVYKALLRVRAMDNPYDIQTIFSYVDDFEGAYTFGIVWTRQRLYSMVRRGLVKKYGSGRRAKYKLLAKPLLAYTVDPFSGKFHTFQETTL